MTAVLFSFIKSILFRITFNRLYKKGTTTFSEAEIS